jgi:hypothetical protein
MSAGWARNVPDITTDGLPFWVKFIAQDADGTWWGFEVEPLQSHHSWYENEVGRHKLLSKEKPNPNWKSTLKAIR